MEGSTMQSDKSLRKHLLHLLQRGSAHLDFDAAVASLPPKARGAKTEGSPHTPWRLLEHMRIAQWDILEFCRNPKHVSPDFPDGYWPESDAPPADRDWDESVKAFRNDLEEMCRLVADPRQDLFEPFPHGDGQTLLREALLVADHNAYHLGQLVLLRRVLGVWQET
jgi:hypothetical protein